ncbi:signal peptidase I [Treponema sp.]|uniref:signal peptidase I n=1 Tax=Treponema sp. TaxID=166 RepID=UPI0025D63B59|nr:signal peptidase I [Treponema sp.]MCR5219178.1 signal peptidase I [Treponema sp.]
MQKLRLYVVINMALSCVFSLLCFPLHADVSLTALPLSLLFTGLLYIFSYKKLIKDCNPAMINVVRRFFQYQPFVFITAFVLLRAGNHAVPLVQDYLSAIVWTALTVLSFMVLFLISDKRVWKLDSSWAQYHEEHPDVKPAGIRRIGFEILEWIDALIQAVFTIVLINIFLFQLYEIPSESMVPAFLVKDRVIVFKTLAGPKFPLSRAGLPHIESYDRGDIVVFRNPHYSDDRKSEVKTFLSQFVYMCTLTLVNINTDENGDLKADPLVKRVTGIPGEQLMLVDGELYTRKKGESFKASGDSSYACWNVTADKSLYNINSGKLKIEKFPVSGITKNDLATSGISLSDAVEIENSLMLMTEEVESMRKKLDLESAALECMSLSRQFAQHAKGGDTDKDIKDLIPSEELLINTFFDNSSLSSLVIKLRQIEGGSAWFDEYMNNWHKDLTSLHTYKETDEEGNLILEGPSLIGENLYTDSLLRLNVMVKLTTGRIMLARLDGNVSVLTENMRVLEKLCNYIVRMDQRNMGLFPADDREGHHSYIPENCYFMMGDNRYNSLDMRHSYEITEKALTEYDDYSIRYCSNLSPQYVSRNKILGKASFRFWPLNRIGFPGKSLRK